MKASVRLFIKPPYNSAFCGRLTFVPCYLVLGHARLAIRDLTPSGNQPLHSPDGTVHAVVNGELYDYEEIKSKLVQETAYPFSSHTDSELVLALYQAYGLDFVQHLRGEFAICIYDEPKSLFIAVRDRYGIKPLFWTVQNGRLLVASEIKAFLPLQWTPEWDVKSIIEAGWNFDDRTLFKDVKKVRPGYVMTCDGNGEIEQRRYWDIEYPDKVNVSFQIISGVFMEANMLRQCLIRELKRKLCRE